MFLPSFLGEGREGEGGVLLSLGWKVRLSLEEERAQGEGRVCFFCVVMFFWCLWFFDFTFFRALLGVVITFFFFL